MMKKILNWFIDEICKTWLSLIYILVVIVITILVFITIPISTQIAFLEKPITELTVAETILIIIWGYIIVMVIKIGNLLTKIP